MSFKGCFQHKPFSDSLKTSFYVISSSPAVPDSALPEPQGLGKQRR